MPFESNLLCLGNKNILAQFACILPKSNVFLMDKRIEMMKYFCTECRAQFKYRSVYANLESKIYFCRHEKQLNWKLAMNFIKKNKLWRISRWWRKLRLDKKLSRNFSISFHFEPPHCAILDRCNININKFITFETKAIYRR